MKHKVLLNMVMAPVNLPCGLAINSFIAKQNKPNLIEQRFRKLKDAR